MRRLFSCQHDDKDQNPSNADPMYFLQLHFQQNAANIEKCWTLRDWKHSYWNLARSFFKTIIKKATMCEKKYKECELEKNEDEHEQRLQKHEIPRHALHE